MTEMTFLAPLLLSALHSHFPILNVHGTEIYSITFPFLKHYGTDFLFCIRLAVEGQNMSFLSF